MSALGICARDKQRIWNCDFRISSYMSLLDKIVNLVLDDMIYQNFNLFISLHLTIGVESEATVVIEGAGHVISRRSQPGNLYIKFKVC